MNPPTDILVVGGGPAGSVTAQLLAKRGWSVTLLDRARFPRAKACGECLNPGAIGTLDRLGLLDRILALDPALLNGWDIAADGYHAVGCFPRSAVGLSLPRARFDTALLYAAREAGVLVEEGTHVVGLSAEPLGAVVRSGNAPARVVRARVVVGADGLRSVVARGLAAYRRTPRLRKLSVTLHVEGIRSDPTRGRLHLDRRGTVGLAPLDPTGRAWNATVVIDADAEGREAAGNPTGLALQRIAELAGEVDARPLEGPWNSGPFDWPGRRAVADGVVLVGDAAGYYDPLTGQGIYRALRSAELAADTIDRALHSGRTDASALAPYDRALRRELRTALRVQRGVEAVVSGSSLRPVALAVLGRSPRVMDALIGVTGDLLPARALLRPDLWVG